MAAFPGSPRPTIVRETSSLTEQEQLERAQRFQLELRKLTFLFQKDPRNEQVKAQILAIVSNRNMAPFYQVLCDGFGWTVDQALMARMKAVNDTELAALDARLADAVENLGENEIREIHLAKFEYYCSIGDKEKTVTAFNECLEKTMALGQKIDLVFSMIRAALFLQDYKLVERNVKKAHQLQELGGDWERRNKLKVYEGLYYVCMRRFKKAALLFLDCVSTFSCYELMPYNTFVYYTVLAAMVGLDRVALRDRVISAPEVITVLHEIPYLESFLTSLYKCKYNTFFMALAHITDDLKLDRYWSPHASYLCREMRVHAYNQFLSSYRSVTLDSMARAFGITVQTLDRELSRFIASKRLNCKIDKVGGIVETVRSDSKNAQYRATITEGDLLLAHIQKLSRVIHV
eukprot:gnl/Spiro4/7177_TR3736_c0_g1_i1.p1 gnl/Spiro4/7177_TR3736_c0_g1~~gnl/Spiro4/7177_TR3736_c0_g1_i1.p1  ORF type:complete len:422 (+),score=133.97 gnl/Spiro4/7177_TR3736_c0_g1_i1:55-1266(+)